MHDHQFAYATYFYAQFFCCFVLFRIILHWYYKPSHFWEHLLLQVLLLFVFPELVVGLLIWQCEKLRKVYPPQDLSQPITWLLESLLLLALVIQVISLWNSCEQYRRSPRLARQVLIVAILFPSLLQPSGMVLSFLTSSRLLVRVLTALGSVSVQVPFAAAQLVMEWEWRTRLGCNASSWATVKQIWSDKASRIIILGAIISFFPAIASLILLVLSQTDYYLWVCVTAFAVIFLSECTGFWNFKLQESNRIGDGNSDA